MASKPLTAELARDLAAKIMSGELKTIKLERYSQGKRKGKIMLSYTLGEPEMSDKLPDDAVVAQVQLHRIARALENNRRILSPLLIRREAGGPFTAVVSIAEGEVK